MAALLIGSVLALGPPYSEHQPPRYAPEKRCKACKRSQFKQCRECRRKARAAAAAFPGEGA